MVHYMNLPKGVYFASVGLVNSFKCLYDSKKCCLENPWYSNNKTVKTKTSSEINSHSKLNSELSLEKESVTSKYHLVITLHVNSNGLL